MTAIMDSFVDLVQNLTTQLIFALKQFYFLDDDGRKDYEGKNDVTAGLW